MVDVDDCFPLMPLSVLPRCDWPRPDKLIVSACRMAADQLREGSRHSIRSRYQQGGARTPGTETTGPLDPAHGYEDRHDLKVSHFDSLTSGSTPTSEVMDLSQRQFHTAP